MAGRIGGEIMKKDILTVPNLITFLRLVGTLGLLFLQPLSAEFFAVYILTGVTDVLDGWIARKTKSASKFGAKLDSVADLLFYSVMIVKLMPLLVQRLSVTLWCAIGATVLVRLSAYITAAIRFHRFPSLHTPLNKLSGAAVFALPFVLLTSIALPLCWCICGITAVASGQELVIHLTAPA